MDAIFLFLGLVLAITILGLFAILGQSPGKPTNTAEKIQGTNFIPSQMYMGSDGLGGLAVNERTRQICLLNSPSSSPRVFPITDLLGSYLIKNGELIGEGKRSNPKQTVTFASGLRRKLESFIKNLQLASSSGSHQRIDLLVMVYDEEDPILMVNFLDMETKEGGILFEKSLSTATHWHYVLDGLILEADRSAQVQEELPQEKELAQTTS